MSDILSNRLYNLLPAIHRLRDRAQGEPLRALLGVMEAEFQLLEEDIRQLYDDWFIETCHEWVVPYIGDLLGVRGLIPLEGNSFSQRGFVANTLAYRRRKGTAAVLEQLTRDVTGWSAKGVEFFQKLSTNQYLNHVRTDSLTTLNLRQTNVLELVNTPFETATHSVDVRHIDNSRGKYNIPNIGIFLWRLQSYFISHTTARSVSFPGAYTFNPLGESIPLFNRPRTETEVTQLAAEFNVPIPLRRRPLYDEIDTLRSSAVDPGNRLYFSAQPVFQVFIAGHEIPLKQIFICNLEEPVPSIPQGWYRPLPIETGQSAAEVAALPATIRDLRVGVDSALGRMVLSRKISATQVEPYTAPANVSVEVSYAYGFPGDLGGGPYNRRESVATWYKPQSQTITWQIGVTQDESERNQTPDQLVATLREAIEQWNTHVNTNSNAFGLIVLMDNQLYDLTAASAAPDIRLPAGSQLAIAAADWIAITNPEDVTRKQRLIGTLVPNRQRAHLSGNLTVQGTASANLPNPGQFILDGVLLEGALTIRPGNLGELHIAHSTILPSDMGDGILVEAQTTAGQQNERLTLRLTRTIVRSLKLAETVLTLQLRDCIVEAENGTAIMARGAIADIEACTILGTTQVRSIKASNSIFVRRVTATLRQTGCVRFSYLPLDSLVPRRFRCHPTDATTHVIPQFTATTYSQPGYGQLAQSCPVEILTGAEDEGEIGAFHFLQQTQRVKNLQTRLDEYLRFGLEIGVFFMN